MATTGWANLSTMAVRETAHLGRHCRTHTCCLLFQLYGSCSRRCGWDGSYTEVIQIHRPFPFAAFSADRSRDSGLHELFCGFLLPGFGPQNQPGLGIHGKRPVSSSVLQSPRNASILFCFKTLSLLWVPKRFRCLATPAFDLNFFELLTLRSFTLCWILLFRSQSEVSILPR